MSQLARESRVNGGAIPALVPGNIQSVLLAANTSAQCAPFAETTTAVQIRPSVDVEVWFSGAENGIPWLVPAGGYATYGAAPGARWTFRAASNGEVRLMEGA